MQNQKRKKNYKSHKYAHLHRCRSNGGLEQHPQFSIQMQWKIDDFPKLMLFVFCFRFSSSLNSNLIVVAHRSEHCTSRRNIGERTKSILIRCSHCTMHNAQCVLIVRSLDVNQCTACSRRASSICRQRCERNFHSVGIVIHDFMNNNHNIFFFFFSMPLLARSLNILKCERRTNASGHTQIVYESHEEKKWGSLASW